MAFLASSDYLDHIQQAQLTALEVGDATARTRMESKAEAEITGYLAVRYDAVNVFNKTGDARNQHIVMIMVDMVLYHLHSRINPGQVPQVRLDRYNEAKAWLEMVSKGQLKPDLPLVGDADGDGTDDNSAVQWGTRTARNPYF